VTADPLPQLEYPNGVETSPHTMADPLATAQGQPGAQRETRAGTREDREAILRHRAMLLAEELSTEAETGGLDVLEFRLGSEEYGVESRYVREVYPLRDYTPLPGTPGFVLGIMSVRGQILSIMDLRVFFDLPGRDAADPDLVVILRSDDIQIAVPVDAVSGVRSVPLADIQPGLPAVSGGAAAYLRGVTGERMSLLDVGKLLADPRIVVGKDVEE
jgi:purine-binding chemotaxis protein CheW